VITPWISKFAFGDAVGFDAQAIVPDLQGSGVVEPQLNSRSVAVQNDGIDQGWMGVIVGIAIDQACQYRSFAVSIGVPGRGSLKMRDGFSNRNGYGDGATSRFSPRIEHCFSSNIPMGGIHLINGLVHKSDCGLGVDGGHDESNTLSIATAQSDRRSDEQNQHSCLSHSSPRERNGMLAGEV